MKTVRWLQWFCLIWLLCSLAISGALLTPLYMAGVQESPSPPPLPEGDPNEMAFRRMTERLKELRRLAVTTPDLSRLPPVEAIRTAALKKKVPVQVQALPASGTGSSRKAQLKLVATGSPAALEDVLKVAYEQLKAVRDPRLGIETWSIRASGSQARLDMTLWALLDQPKR